MNIFERAIKEPFEGLYERILQFLPNFLTSLVLLIAGIILGCFFRLTFAKVLKAARVDRLSERSGINELLQKGGLKEPLSVLLSRIVGWLVVFIFIFIALRALEVPTVQQLLESFLLYLPNVVVAVLILIFGYLLSNFLGRAALIASVNAGIKMSGLIGKLVKLTVLVLSITMSLEQLGIGSGTITIAFAVLFGGVVLALALAFGLGGRDLAREYLEKRIKGGEENKDEINHL